MVCSSSVHPRRATLHLPSSRQSSWRQWGVECIGSHGQRERVRGGVGEVNDQTAFATRSVTVPRFTAPRLSVRTTPRTDTTSPYRFTTTGRLTPAASVSPAKGCRGVVAVQIKAGSKTISTRRVTLSKDCTYRSRVAFTLPRRLRTRTLRVQATYAGNSVLNRKSSPQITVRTRK
jgi:hypothetical protein